jgi:hypothetical protein
MINRKKAQKILWYETIGFLFLITLSWLNELISLPHLIFGSGEHSSIHEALIETVVLVGVWLIVVTFTSQLLGRLHYLEGFLRVCAWCRKIGHEDKWMTLENFFAQGFAMKTSHGMCSECERKWDEDSKEPAIADTTSTS